MEWKGVAFCGHGGKRELEISNWIYGNKDALSNANQQGFNVTIDSKGRNMLTGHNKDGKRVSLNLLEVFEVECLNPPKKPEMSK